MKNLWRVAGLVFLGLLVCASVWAGSVIAVQDQLDWRGMFTLVLFVVIFIVLFTEILPAEITLFVGACLLVVTDVISPDQFVRGFAHDILVSLAMLFVIARALEATGALGYVARRFLPKAGRYWKRLLSMIVPVSCVSAFVNNTPVVLMMTTIVRQWAVECKDFPSRYLMPISFAAILGGICTLIGTSTNLVVQGLIVDANPAAKLSFFELAWVGVPCLLLGTGYLLLFSKRLLPRRREPSSAVIQETREFTTEFLVTDECPLVGMSLEAAAHRHFPEAYLVEIKRSGESIPSPTPETVIEEGDQLVFAADIREHVKLMAIKGLTSLADPQFQLDLSSPHFSEVVVAMNSWLVGKTVRRALFRTRYNASVLAVYRQGDRVEGVVSEILLHPGDTLILISNEPWHMRPEFRNDLYPIVYGIELPVFVPKRAIFTVAVLAVMVVIVTLGVPLFYASIGAAGLLMATRIVTIRQARNTIDWRLLLLIASAFIFGSALTSTGVAELIGQGIVAVVGSHPYGLVACVLIVTLILTEFITNAAAVVLVFPIGYQSALLAGFEPYPAAKAMGVAVAIAASSSFLTPIGYQTNTIIYGPGGYKFSDFVRLGFGLTVIVFVVATLLIPTIWPLRA